MARVALDAAVSLDGVAGGDAGRFRRWVTFDRDETLAGVLAVERSDGRFDVELHLVADWPVPPLAALAEKIDKKVTRAASAAGLADALGPLSIAFEDVREPARIEQKAS